MDKSGSKHVLCTYPTPNRTNRALYLSGAGQIRLQAIFSFKQSYKIRKNDSRFLITIIFVCLAVITKKYMTLFFHYTYDL